MAAGVIAHGMTAVMHPLNKLGIPLYQILEYEEAAVRPVCVKRVDYLFNVAVFIASIEGKIDNLLAALTAVIAIISPVLLGKFHSRVKQRGSARIVRDKIPPVRCRRRVRYSRYRVRGDSERGEQQNDESYYTFFHYASSDLTALPHGPFSFAKNFAAATWCQKIKLH